MLIKIMAEITSKLLIEKKSPGTNHKINAKKLAIAIFAKTPADATNTSLKLPFNMYGLYGTGFAQPATPPEVRKKITGTTKEPIKSRCFKGFGVRRPAIFAVGSPQIRAA